MSRKSWTSPDPRKVYRGGTKPCFWQTVFFRAELKVTDLMWWSPICGFLRFSAKIFGFLQKSAVPAPSTCLNFQEKGRICENRRFSAKICVLGFLCHLSSVPLSASRVFVPSQKGAVFHPAISGPKVNLCTLFLKTMALVHHAAAKTKRCCRHNCLKDWLELKESKRQVAWIMQTQRSRSMHFCCGVIIWAKFGLLRCYYLGQVCFLQKHCLSKNTIKIGVSAFFFCKKKLRRANLRCYYLGQVGHF